jgi:hypothetical protein
MDILTAAQILDRIKPGASVMLDTHSDEATMERIARNLAAFNEGTLSGAEAAGIFSVNVDELLEIIARLSGPRAVTGRHAR